MLTWGGDAVFPAKDSVVDFLIDEVRQGGGFVVWLSVFHCGHGVTGKERRGKRDRGGEEKDPERERETRRRGEEEEKK